MLETPLPQSVLGVSPQKNHWTNRIESYLPYWFPFESIQIQFNPLKSHSHSHSSPQKTHINPHIVPIFSHRFTIPWQLHHCLVDTAPIVRPVYEHHLDKNALWRGVNGLLDDFSGIQWFQWDLFIGFYVFIDGISGDFNVMGLVHSQRLLDIEFRHCSIAFNSADLPRRGRKMRSRMTLPWALWRFFPDIQSGSSVFEISGRPLKSLN